jgi:hypothetical protein
VEHFPENPATDLFAKCPVLADSPHLLGKYFTQPFRRYGVVSNI